MPHLLHFTIGPVQSFIAQARKTKDLYAGSCILAELCKAAIKEADENQGLSLLFPKLSSRDFDDIKSIPNRFVAALEGQKTEEELRKIGEAIKEAVGLKLKEIAAKAIKEANAPKYKSEKKLSDLKQISEQKEIELNSLQNLPRAFYEQLEQSIDIQWVFIPYSEEKYHLAYRLIDKLMGAVKNTRMFKQYQYEGTEYGEKGRKCSLDGERNALFFGKDSTKTFSATNVEELNCQDVYLRKNEGLSAVSFVKRFYPIGIDENFPSVAEISLMHIVSEKSTNREKNADNKALNQAINNFKDAFSQGKIVLQLLEENKKQLKLDENFWLNFKDDFHEEWQFLYEENINKEQIRNDYQRHEIKHRFDAIKRALDGKLLCRYYAVLTFDGDRMGKWLSGEYLLNKSQLKDFQGFLSNKLVVFAKEAERIVDEPHGKTIYAGGDDFLGLVNLDSLFDVVNKLRTKFEQLVNEEIKTKYTLNEDFTFSAGIAIAHYKTPLNIVLNAARTAQETAKEDGNRDAFAIKIMKHSGESNLVFHNWNLKEKVNQVSGNLSFIGYIIDRLKKGHFSKTFIYNLETEMDALLDSDGRMGNSIPMEHRNQLFEFELHRLVSRACIVKKEDNEEKEAFKKRKEAIIIEMQNVLLALAKSGKLENGDYVVRDFLGTLSVCSFLSRNLSTNNE